MRNGSEHSLDFGLAFIQSHILSGGFGVFWLGHLALSWQLRRFIRIAAEQP
jgi:hypothetical protein